MPYSGDVDLTSTSGQAVRNYSLESAGPLQANACATGNLRLPGGAGHVKARLGAGGRPWVGLHAKLQQSLAGSKLLDTDSLLVAVSGGQDSVCLLQALADLQPLWRWRLGVVHCDHGWRTDSAANAEFVREMAEQRFGLPCHVRVAPPGSVPNEGSAREWRYRVFAEVAAAHGYGVVVTGHTATDRAETMLLNLLRGSGPDGLVALARSRPLGPAPSPGQAQAQAWGDGGSSGLSPSDSHATCDLSRDLSCDSSRDGAVAAAPPPARLARPLLEFSRGDTQEFVQALGLPYFHDSTNDCNDLRRNRLRNEVLPLLRQDFNPRLDQALARFLEVLGAEMDYLEHMTDELYGNVVSEGRGRPDAYRDSDGVQSIGESSSCGGSSAIRARECGAVGVQQQASCSGGGAALKLGELRQLPLAMQRRVVRKWLEAANDGFRSGSSACGEGDDEGDASCGGGRGSGGRGQRGGAGRQVRYEDVARCLALLHAPNRANSDSLCGGMVASVRDGQLVLFRAPRADDATGEPKPARQRPQQQLQQRLGRRAYMLDEAREPGSTGPQVPRHAGRDASPGPCQGSGVALEGASGGASAATRSGDVRRGSPRRMAAAEAACGAGHESPSEAPPRDAANGACAEHGAPAWSSSGSFGATGPLDAAAAEASRVAWRYPELGCDDAPEGQPGVHQAREDEAGVQQPGLAMLWAGTTREAVAAGAAGRAPTHTAVAVAAAVHSEGSLSEGLAGGSWVRPSGVRSCDGGGGGGVGDAGEGAARADGVPQAVFKNGGGRRSQPLRFPSPISFRFGRTSKAVPREFC